PGGLQFDRHILIAVGLTDNALELNQVLGELIGGDGALELVVEARARNHGLGAAGRRLDLGVRAAEKGLARVDQVGDGDAPVCALSADGGRELILDRPVGVDVANEFGGEGFVHRESTFGTHSTIGGTLWPRRPARIRCGLMCSTPGNFPAGSSSSSGCWRRRTI